MTIAILGWGSLVWDLKKLEINSQGWFEDGPILNIEFCRFSSKKRITLVINGEYGDPCTTYWAQSVHTDLSKVVTNLKDREGVPTESSIHWFDTSGKTNCNDTLTITRIEAWLKSKPNIKAVVWTGLTSNWNDKSKGRGVEFSLQDFKVYLEMRYQEGEYEDLLEYFIKAPKQTKTRGRDLALKIFKQQS